MKVSVEKNSSLKSYDSGVIVNPSEDGARFRLRGLAGVLIIDGAQPDGNTGFYEGTEAFVALPSHVAMHLPHQAEGDTTLLDMHMPLDADYPGARTTPGEFRLACIGGGVVSAARGVLLEYMPEPANA